MSLSPSKYTHRSSTVGRYTVHGLPPPPPPSQQNGGRSGGLTPPSLPPFPHDPFPGGSHDADADAADAGDGGGSALGAWPFSPADGRNKQPGWRERLPFHSRRGRSPYFAMTRNKPCSVHRPYCAPGVKHWVLLAQARCCEPPRSL